MATLILCLWAFSEAFIFPIPPDPFLIALVLANKKKFFLYCTVCTACSVLGGITGYYIGFIFWDEIGVHITEYFALTDQINSFKELYNENGSLAVFIAGVSPIPYKLVTIISGISSMNFFYFCFFSLLSRGLRFFLIGFLIFWFGSRVQNFVENRLSLLSLIIIAIIVIIILLSRFL
jgi:membrane protein YqaA with SNARE-associated domain